MHKTIAHGTPVVQKTFLTKTPGRLITSVVIALAVATALTTISLAKLRLDASAQEEADSRPRTGIDVRPNFESPSADSYQVLHSFTGNDGHGFNGDTDGANPAALLLQGPDGNLYGTTLNGSSTATGGTGTVFKMDRAGNVTILHHFLMAAGGDGANPYGGLILARDGNFFGTTYTAVGATGSGFNGGVVFKISSSGAYTKLHTFQGAEGGYPKAGVIEGKDGNFYGTTVQGAYNRGAIYKMSPNGKASLLDAFTGAADGFQPVCNLLQTVDGYLYGTTWRGGTSGLGVVFRISTGGAFTVLHTFKGTAGADGATPLTGLIQATDGNFYGTTSGGGQYGFGTVFKMDASGTITLLYSFRGTDGADPRGSLIQATDGNFYGTTYSGPNTYGTVFKVTPNGAFTLLHTFPQARGDGVRPTAGLIQATDGSFYGTTYYGGSQNKGMVFRLSLSTLTRPTANVEINYGPKRKAGSLEIATSYRNGATLKTENNTKGEHRFAHANGYQFVTNETNPPTHEAKISKANWRRNTLNRSTKHFCRSTGSRRRSCSRKLIR